jgi:hypothetical protein
VLNTTTNSKLPINYTLHDHKLRFILSGKRQFMTEGILLAATQLNQLASTDWSTPRQTSWRLKPLSMVVTKTFQHTYEHGDTLLRMGLWWEETLD